MREQEALDEAEAFKHRGRAGWLDSRSLEDGLIHLINPRGIDQEALQQLHGASLPIADLWMRTLGNQPSQS